MKRFAITTAILLAMAVLFCVPALAAEPQIFNWLKYGPPPGFTKHPWTFRREVLDPMFGSKQPHFLFKGACFKDSDPDQPQPQEIVRIVKQTTAGSLGQYYAKVVILNIEFPSWNPYRELCEVNTEALHKLIWYVQEVKRGLPDYKVGLWGLLPSRRMHHLFFDVTVRDMYWDYNAALKPLGEVVDFTVPNFYWVLDPDDSYYFSLWQRTRGVEIVCAISHEMYGKPCYPIWWPECYRRFQDGPWPDTEECQRSRQMTAEEAQQMVDACLKYGDGYVLWSQPLVSAPPKHYTPFRWDYPWVSVLMDAGRRSSRLSPLNSNEKCETSFSLAN